MTIREATKNDIDTLISLYSQLRPTDKFNKSEMMRIMEEINNDSQTIIFLTEADAGDIVSTCEVVIIKNLTHSCRPFAIIENVVTDVSHRGQGYGKAVIDYAIRYANEMNCHKIMLQTRQKAEYVMLF